MSCLCVRGPRKRAHTQQSQQLTLESLPSRDSLLLRAETPKFPPWRRVSEPRSPAPRATSGPRHGAAGAASSSRARCQQQLSFYLQIHEPHAVCERRRGTAPPARRPISCGFSCAAETPPAARRRGARGWGWGGASPRRGEPNRPPRTLPRSPYGVPRWRRPAVSRGEAGSPRGPGE